MTEVKGEYRVEGQPIQADVLETYAIEIAVIRTLSLPDKPDGDTDVGTSKWCAIRDLVAEVRRLRARNEAAIEAARKETHE